MNSTYRSLTQILQDQNLSLNHTEEWQCTIRSNFLGFIINIIRLLVLSSDLNNYPSCLFLQILFHLFSLQVAILQTTVNSNVIYYKFQ